jgi:biopolymer transport protein ExbD
MHIEAATGRRRPLDAGINIVPYIDLLMTLMVFLMVTAVWTHTSTLEAKSASTGDSSTARDDDAKPATVTLTAGGIHVDTTHFAPNDVDGAVAALVARGRDAPLELKVDDGVAFARVAAFMDAARGAKLATPTLQPSPQ